MYADLNLKRCVQAANCPSLTYATDDSMTCTSTCPDNTFISGKFCVSFCPDGNFTDKINKRCVNASSCPTDYYAD